MRWASLLFLIGMPVAFADMATSQPVRGEATFKWFFSITDAGEEVKSLPTDGEFVARSGEQYVVFDELGYYGQIVATGPADARFVVKRRHLPAAEWIGTGHTVSAWGPLFPVGNPESTLHVQLGEYDPRPRRGGDGFDSINYFVLNRPCGGDLVCMEVRSCPDVSCPRKNRWGNPSLSGCRRCKTVARYQYARKADPRAPMRVIDTVLHRPRSNSIVDGLRWPKNSPRVKETAVRSRL